MTRIALPEVPLTTSVLQSGVTVVTAHLPHHPRAHVFVQLRGGPVHESDETWGLSHFFEHMVFRGTARHRDARAVSLAADDFGGDVGAATYRDRVVFDTRCDPSRVVDALDLLAAMLGGPRFVGLAVEKAIIEEELAELYDDEGQEIDVDNAVFRQMFAGHVLSRSIEGTPEVLGAFDKRAVRALHAAFFGAQNLVLSVAGPLAHKQVVAHARKTLGRLSAGSLPPAGVAPAPSRERIVEVIRTDDAQTSVRLCFSAPGMKSPQAPALAVLGRLLDDGPASRLQANVIDRDGLAYSVWAVADLYEERGLIELGSSVRHDRVAVLVEALVREVVGLARRTPRAEEVHRVQQRYARDARDLLDDPASVAEAAGKGAVFGEPLDPGRSVRRVQAVRPASVQALARRIFRQPRLVLVGLPSRQQVAQARDALCRL